jgi:hypothetical protein
MVEAVVIRYYNPVLYVTTSMILSSIYFMCPIYHLMQISICHLDISGKYLDDFQLNFGRL